MESIHVLFRQDSLGHVLGGNMCGKRQLNDITVDVGIGIQLINGLQKFLFTDIRVEFLQGGLETNKFAGLYLAADIGLAGAIVADQNGCQVRNLTALVTDQPDFFGDFALDFLGGCDAIDDGCHNFYSANCLSKTRKISGFISSLPTLPFKKFQGMAVSGINLSP